VRWDRVLLLAALVGVLVLVAAHAVSHSGGSRSGRPGGRVNVSRVPATVAKRTAAKPTSCRPPARRAIRTAPSSGGARTVALTFDDGPGPWTPEVLAVLKRKKVQATFFVIGRQAARRPETVRRIVSAGHAVGDHTWSHAAPRTPAGWSTRGLAQEIDRTQRVLQVTTGIDSCLFRPPEGVLKGATRPSRAAGVSIVLWSVDPHDWALSGPRSASKIRDRARSGLEQRHPVILLHDGGGDRAGTVSALPAIIDDYRRHGYRFVTLDRRP